LFAALSGYFLFLRRNFFFARQIKTEFDACDELSTIPVETICAKADQPDCVVRLRWCYHSPAAQLTDGKNTSGVMSLPNLSASIGNARGGLWTKSSPARQKFPSTNEELPATNIGSDSLTEI